ncbi:hypothetical protein HMI51_03490 [Corallococcus coralloides]|nr:hypothetical protein [Corallococcus coralloides]
MLLVLHPEEAARVLAGGSRVYCCATCGAWLNAASAMTHQDIALNHEMRGFNAPPTKKDKIVR